MKGESRTRHSVETHPVGVLPRRQQSAVQRLCKEPVTRVRHPHAHRVEEVARET